MYDIGFPYIGQIQSGNVLMFENGDYVLGGYENTLLGYRSSCYQALKEAMVLDQIDVIMFGKEIKGYLFHILILNTLLRQKWKIEVCKLQFSIEI